MRLTCVLGTVVALCVTGLTSLSALAAEHPRLLLSPAEVPTLRERIKKEPIASMVAKLKADVNTGNWGAGPLEGGYDGITSAHRHAFLYVLTKDDEHAKQARTWVEKITSDKNWANKGIKGLTLYYQGIMVSFIYDHCHGAPSWDAAFSKTVSEKLKAQGDAIYTSGGREQNNNAASNWQALRYSSAGLCYMATDEAVDQKSIEASYGRVQRYLRENLGADKDSKGWNIEGLGYNYYPMGNGVAPFTLAMARKDPTKDLRKDIAGTRYTLWTTYAAMVPTPTGLWRPDFGDDNPGTNSKGTHGFAFAFCPDEIKPGLKYWYDRSVGSKGNKSYDPARFGTVASILYYPIELAEKDPMTIPEWRGAMAEKGGNGYTTFRNHYKDNTDICAQLYAKLRGDKGHGGPDALSFRIVGLDTIWGTGGGRYGPKVNGQDAYWRSQNTLYPVDPDDKLTTNGNSGKYVAGPVVNETGGGSVVMAINQNNVGTKNHTRRFLADFTQSGASAAFVISDTSDDGKFWEFNTLDTNKITTDKNSFTVTTATGHTLKGTVLYPASTTFKTGTRLRGSSVGDIKNNNFVHFTSDDGDYLVVITLAEKGKAHPAATAAGTWSDSPNGTVTLGKLKATIKGDTIE